jgi:CTP:molybdopterin cytidylyltransferase MocA
LPPIGGSILGILLAADSGGRFVAVKLLHRLADGTPTALVVVHRLRQHCETVLVVAHHDGETLTALLVA